MNYSQKLEALLFAAGDPVSKKDCMRLLEVSGDTFEETIKDLTTTLESRGIRLLQHEDNLTLVTAAEVSDIVEKVAKEQLEGNLSRSALETLAVILWKGKASRSAIDYVRGVNSAFALRTLLIRGLIEREQDPADARVYTYKPTVELFKYLGITSSQDLPEFTSIREQLQEHPEQSNE